MKKSAEKLNKPDVTIAEQELDAAGFILSGKRKFKEVVTAFSDELFLKSVRYCDAGTRDNDREVSAENVYNAVKKIYATPLEQHKKINTFLYVIEHLGTLLVGVGASNYKEVWGFIMCLLSLMVAVGCFMYRTLSKYE